MNKKLLTLAVAAALAAPAVASAEAILYGKLNVSLDYIDVDQNATFYRPGTTQSPNFSLSKFAKGDGSWTASDALGALGTYPIQRFGCSGFPGNTTGGCSGDLNNPLNFNPWRGLPLQAASGAGQPYNAGLGSQVMSNFDPAAQAAYYKAASASLRSAKPLNALGWAQTAGAVELETGYGYNSQYPSNVTAAALANGQASYINAYNSAIKAGLSVAEAQAQASTIAANAYDAIAKPAWNDYQKAVTKAENAAFTTVAPQAGQTVMNTYFSSQRAKLTNDLQIGNIDQTYYRSASKRLTQLQNLANAAEVAGAFTPGRKYKGWGMDTSNSVNGPADRVGVKGSEDLGNGLKAVYQIEIGVDITNANRDTNLINGNRGTTTTNSGFAFRNTFIGLAGDWGTFMMGRYDTPMKISTAKLDLFADTLADMNATIGFQDLRVDNTVAYISPSWSGFQLALAIVPQNGATGLGALDNSANSIAGAASVAAIYKNGPFYGSIAYEQLNKSNWESLNGDYMSLYGNQVAKDDKKFRVGLGLLDWNGFTVTGIFEQRNNILGAPTKADGKFFQVQAGYAFGNNMVKAMWGRANLEQCADPNNVGFRYTCQASELGQIIGANGGLFVNNKQKSSFAVGYDYNFSKRTTAFALYTKVSDQIQNADWSGFSIGMMHSF